MFDVSNPTSAGSRGVENVKVGVFDAVNLPHAAASDREHRLCLGLRFPATGKAIVQNYITRTVMHPTLQLPLLLGRTCDLTGTLPAPSVYSSNLIRFSVAGIPQSNQLTVHHDGKDVEWVVEVGVGKDRYLYFYECLNVEGGFSDGEHEIRFVLNYDDPDRIVGSSEPQLCRVNVLEYGGSHEYAFI